MSAPLACGVVGVGYLGYHHARLYAATPGARLAGVFDIDGKRAARVAREFGAEAFPTLEALAAECTAVSVAVPTEAHAEVARRLLDAGCHVLVEKPICATLAEAEELVAAAHKAACIVQVGHVEHFNPVMAFLEANVAQPRFITCDRLAPFRERGLDVDVVLDLMIHDLGVVLQLVKSPLVRLEAVGVNVLSASNDLANARLKFADGCVANFNTSRVSRKTVREIRVFQPNTYLSLNFAEQKGHLIRKNKLGVLNKRNVPLEKGEPLALEIAAFLDAVREHRRPQVDGQFGRRTLEIATRVLDSIGSGAAWEV